MKKYDDVLRECYFARGGGDIVRCATLSRGDGFTSVTSKVELEIEEAERQLQHALKHNRVSDVRHWKHKINRLRA